MIRTLDFNQYWDLFLGYDLSKTYITKDIFTYVI